MPAPIVEPMAYAARQQPLDHVQVLTSRLALRASPEALSAAARSLPPLNLYLNRLPVADDQRDRLGPPLARDPVEGRAGRGCENFWRILNEPDRGVTGADIAEASDNSCEMGVPVVLSRGLEWKALRRAHYAQSAQCAVCAFCVLCIFAVRTDRTFRTLCGLCT